MDSLEGKTSVIIETIVYKDNTYVKCDDLILAFSGIKTQIDQLDMLDFEVTGSNVMHVLIAKLKQLKTEGTK